MQIFTISYGKCILKGVNYIKNNFSQYYVIDSGDFVGLKFTRRHHGHTKQDVIKQYVLHEVQCNCMLVNT